MSTRLAFRYSCFCLPPFVDSVVRFEVHTPDLLSHREMFQSCISSLQHSYITVLHVSSPYTDQRLIGTAFRLLVRGQDLLSNRKVSIWNLLKGSGPEELF